MEESIKVANQIREKKAKEAPKNSFDKKSCKDPLEVGPEVLPAGARGVSAAWEGPFTILAKPTPVTYQITAICRKGGVQELAEEVYPPSPGNLCRGGGCDRRFGSITNTRVPQQG